MENAISIPGKLVRSQIIRVWTCTGMQNFDFGLVDVTRYFDDLWITGSDEDPAEVAPSHEEVVGHLRFMRSSGLSNKHLLAYQVLLAERVDADVREWSLKEMSKTRDVKSLSPKVFVCAEPHMKIMTLGELGENAAWVTASKGRVVINDDARHVSQHTPIAYKELSSNPPSMNLLKINRIVYVPLQSGVTEYHPVPGLSKAA